MFPVTFIQHLLLNLEANRHIKRFDPTDSTNQVPVWNEMVSTLQSTNGSDKSPVAEPSRLNQNWLPVATSTNTVSFQFGKKEDFAHINFRSLTLKRSDSYFLSLDSVQTAPSNSDAENDSSNLFRIFQITSSTRSEQIMKKKTTRIQ